MLLVVSQAAMMLLFEEMVRRWGLIGDLKAAQAPDWAMFLLGMAVTGVVIVWHLLLLGFLKTAAMEGAMPKDPLVLLMVGRPYLWRILLVQFVLSMLLWLVSGVIIYAYFAATGRAIETEPPGWLYEIAGAAATVVVFKPFFLIPAFIVALNLRIKESLILMLRVSIKDAKGLLKAVLVGYAASAAIGVGLSFVPEEGWGMYAASGVNYLAKSVILLVLLMAAVLWAMMRFLPPEPPENTK